MPPAESDAMPRGKLSRAVLAAIPSPLKPLITLPPLGATPAKVLIIPGGNTSWRCIAFLSREKVAQAKSDDFVAVGPMTRKSRRVKAARKFIFDDEYTRVYLCRVESPNCRGKSCSAMKEAEDVLMRPIRQSAMGSFLRLSYEQAWSCQEFGCKQFNCH